MMICIDRGPSLFAACWRKPKFRDITQPRIGTLFAFVVVCAAVLILRFKDPDAPRSFKAPLGLFCPIGGIVLCLVLMFSLGWENWVRLFIWLGIGLAIYFVYGFHHSKLRIEDNNLAKKL